MKVQTRRPRPVTMAVPPSALPFPPTNTPTVPSVPSTGRSSPELPAPEPHPAPQPNPAPAEPIVYEILRRDANGGNVRPLENTYLVPTVAQGRAVQPLDLSVLLASQQMNAAAGGGSALPVDNSILPSGTELLGVVRKVCQQPGNDAASPIATQPLDDEYYDDTRDARQNQSSQQFSLYTNMRGASATSSDTAPLIDFTTDCTAADSAADSVTTTTTSNILRRSSLPVTSVARPSPCGSAAVQPFTFRLPSYEESMSSETASVSLSPVASPLFAADETTVATSPSATVLTSYDSPPAYASERLLELSANTPLKSRQVQQLQDEMANAAGIRVQLDKKQCSQALALIDCFDCVWSVSPSAYVNYWFINSKTK